MHDRHGPAPVSGGGMGMDGGGSPGQAAGAYQARYAGNGAGAGAGAGAAVMAAGGGARGRDTAGGHGSATGHGRSGDGRAGAGAMAQGYGRGGGAGVSGHGDGARAGWQRGGGEAISGGVQGRAGHGAYSEGGLWPGGEAGDGPGDGMGAHPGDGLGARPGAGAQSGPEDGNHAAQAREEGGASHDVYALELPRHMAVDPAVEGRFKALCAQTGFTPEQARAAVDFWVAETEAAAGHSMEQCEATLRKQWGRGYGERLEGARQAARVLDGRMGGRLGRLLQGPMGNSPEVVEMLSHVAGALNEDSVGAPGAVPGGAAAGSHGPMSTEEFLRNVVFKR